MEIQAYINKVYEFIFPNQKIVNKETFEGEPIQVGASMGIAAILMFLITILLSFLYSYGAAKLSWHYNMYMGNSGSAFIWSLISFFFSGFYYPYYALFLDPVATMKHLNSVSVGGRRR